MPPAPADPHTGRLAAMSSLLAVLAVALACFLVARLRATSEALRVAEAACAGLRAEIFGGDSPENDAPLGVAATDGAGTTSATADDASTTAAEGEDEDDADREESDD